MPEPTPPVISVGIPFKDPGVFFPMAVASVFAQTLAEWELILIDDGSLDGSLEYARSISDPRVRVVSDGLNRGLSVRLNQLAALATTRWLVRMDADDVMHPDRLQVVIEALRSVGSATVVGSRAFAIDQDNRVRGIKTSVPCSGYAGKRSFIHPTVAAATVWFREHPYAEDPALARCEDGELWCRCADVTRYVVLEQPLLFYREFGHFSLANYLATQRGLRELIRRRFSRPRALAFARHLVIELKSACTLVLWSIGCVDWLVRRRSYPLTSSDAERAVANLARALAARVPRR